MPNPSQHTIYYVRYDSGRRPTELVAGPFLDADACAAWIRVNVSDHMVRSHRVVTQTIEVVECDE